MSVTRQGYKTQEHHLHAARKVNIDPGAMKFSLLLITTAAVAWSDAHAGRLPTSTEAPCPMICIAGQPPVCAEVSPGRFIRYSGECMKHMCECMLNRGLTQVDMSKCRGALIDKCPLRLAAAQTPADADANAVADADSDSDNDSDSDESLSA